MGQSMMY